jgi:hypothetical protein
LFATAETAEHQWTLYGVDAPLSPAPGLTFNIASWEVSYQAQDNVLPGIVPSTCSVEVFGGLSIGDWRTILGDASGKYILEQRSGLDVIWRGFMVPDNCQIEVINGQRFIRLAFSDGFQMLDRRADFYQYTGTKSFTDQIKDIFNLSGFWDCYTGFFVSEHLQPSNKGITTNQGGLWWTGCIQEGLWFKDGEFRTYREALNDILATFGLVLFQDRGELVFRTVWLETPAWYNWYSKFGAFVERLTFSNSPESLSVYADGTEMYKPAFREVFLIHNQPSQGIIRDESTVNKIRNGYFVGNVTPTGANHIDWDSVLDMRLSFDAGFPGGTIEVEFYVTIQFGNYFWNGSNWTTTSSFLTFSKKDNFGPGPSLETIQVIISSEHLDTLPTIGTEPMYYTVTGTQTSGYMADTLLTRATMYFAYHNANPNATIYYADNTSRINGVTTQLTTELGDIWTSSGVAAALPGEIRCFTSTARTTAYGNIYWDSDQNLLLSIVAYQLARKSYQPGQYYELDLHETHTYNHLFEWDGVDYRPVNMTFNDRDSRATYRALLDGNIVTSADSKRPDQEL